MMKKFAFGFTFFLLTYVDLLSFDIKGRGASFPAPLYREWIKNFYNKTENRVNFTQSGSGDGIKSIRRRMVDFGATDKPLEPRLIEKYKLLMFPVVIGSIVLTYNLPGIKDGQLKLSEEAIVGIFDAAIDYWDDPKIKMHNPKLHLPHKKINVVVRADKSGTTYNFSYYLSKISSELFQPSKKPQWKGSIIGAKSNAGVSATVEQTKYSIGYIEYSYKIKLHLPAAQVENREGNFVLPAMDTFYAAIQNAQWSKENDFYALIAYPKGKDSYPIVAATFILLPREEIVKNRDIVAFFEYAFKYGDEEAIELGYVPLPDSTKMMIRSYWKEKQVQ